ncbi:MAG TPA: acyltransferase [Burkholderiales bacterium]|nr:acyltransferase [Burkholderiales bacterium]
MDVSSPWPFFVINVACLATGWIIVARSRFYRQHVQGLRQGRTGMLDGLRGWLALGVFFQHAMTHWFLHTQGKWDAAASPFYELAGEIGVSLFFMITGFLFWTRVLQSGGKLDARALYLSRVRRIVPMYLVSVFMVLAVVGTMSGFSLRVGLPELARELRAWFSFGFMYAGGVNGVQNAHYIEAVYWTLAYEWVFYLALPFLGLFVRPLAFIALLGVFGLYGLREPVTLSFAFGAVAAVVLRTGALAELLPRSWLGLVPLACLAAVFALPSAFGFAPGALLFVFFVFVVHGNSLFGLLASAGARLLGTVSYSIYLVHCIVLFVVMRIVDAHGPIATIGPLGYWFFAGLAGVLAVLVSAITYRYVEHPFLATSVAPGRQAAAQVVEIRDALDRSETARSAAAPGRSSLLEDGAPGRI